MPEVKNRARGQNPWNLPSCRRAISPILATLLLIVLLVVAAIVAYAWIQSYTQTQTATAGAFMRIENVRFYDINKIEITIRNTGTTDLTVDAVYLDGARYSAEQAIRTGEAESVVIEYFWESRERCRIKVVSTSGVFAEGTYAAPSKVWYDESWTRRKPVTINNTLNPNDLTNYQVKINFQYDSDMNNDFSDLRFTDGDGQTLISYWIESYVTLDYAIVWINVPSIYASSTKTVYMYYGNPSASSESNPDYTFDLFVNFTRDGVISHGGSSQDIDSTQWEIMNDTTLRMWGNNWKASMKTVNVNGDGSQVINFDFKSIGTQGEINGVGLDTDNGLSSNRFYRIYGTQSWGINDHYGYTGSGDWQSYSLILNDFSGSFNRFVFTNDADAGQATNIYYRNVRVCKYTFPEPTINVGTEETL